VRCLLCSYRVSSADRVQNVLTMMVSENVQRISLPQCEADFMCLDDDDGLGVRGVCEERASTGKEVAGEETDDALEDLYVRVANIVNERGPAEGRCINVKYAMLLPLWDENEDEDKERVRGVAWCRARLEALLEVIVAGNEEGVAIAELDRASLGFVLDEIYQRKVQTSAQDVSSCGSPVHRKRQKLKPSLPTFPGSFMQASYLESSRMEMYVGEAAEKAHVGTRELEASSGCAVDSAALDGSTTGAVDTDGSAGGAESEDMSLVQMHNRPKVIEEDLLEMALITLQNQGKVLRVRALDHHRYVSVRWSHMWSLNAEPARVKQSSTSASAASNSRNAEGSGTRIPHGDTSKVGRMRTSDGKGVRGGRAGAKSSGNAGAQGCEVIDVPETGGVARCPGLNEVAEEVVDVDGAHRAEVVTTADAGGDLETRMKEAGGGALADNGRCIICDKCSLLGCVILLRWLGSAGKFACCHM